MSSVAIIAAMDRELAPLVVDWQSHRIDHNGRNFRVYEQEGYVAVAGGIGRRAAATVARTVIGRYHPRLLISAGVAGALNHDLKVGALVTPNVIIDSSTGVEYPSENGSGVLVTASEIVDRTAKRALAEKFHAVAVDMEAAAVAVVAQQERIPFCCVKAISEEADFAMPPLNQFVDQEGQFHIIKFLLWAISRPWWWPGIAALGRNTDRAATTLCEYLKNIRHS